VEEVGVPVATARRILQIFDAPGLDEVAEAFRDHESVVERMEEIQVFLGILDDLGLSGFVEFDLTIVRGLAYYTGIVFEIFDREGDFRAICGGGRYDRLLELVGGEPLPAVGFGMGDVVLSDLLTERQMAPDFRRQVDYFIVVIGDEQASLARRIAGARRARGDSVIYGVRGQSVRKQFSAAANEGALEVVVLGPEEVARGAAVVRDMASGEERTVGLDHLMGHNEGAGTPAGGAMEGPGA